jgi:hypothetical protein
MQLGLKCLKGTQPPTIFFNHDFSSAASSSHLESIDENTKVRQSPTLYCSALNESACFRGISAKYGVDSPPYGVDR